MKNFTVHTKRQTTKLQSNVKLTMLVEIYRRRLVSEDSLRSCVYFQNSMTSCTCNYLNHFINMNKIYVFEFSSCLRPRELSCNLQNNANFIISKNQDWLELVQSLQKRLSKCKSK